jgi:hypothetical protein
MLIRGLKRLVAFVSPLVILIFIFLRFYDERLTSTWPFHGGQWTERFFPVWDTNHQHSKPLQDSLSTTTSNEDSGTIETDLAETHREVLSVSTADKRYFLIDFGEQGATNPSIIPHPLLNDTWIIVAQQQKNPVIKNSVWFAELVCNAAFKDDGATLGCINPPVILPIAATSGDKCVGDLAYFALNIGPHDARVFYGPKTPYTIYGSNSVYTCFGQWMLDFRMLVDWGFEVFAEKEFRKATELQRPAPYGPVEKNWFVFWDKHEEIYAHYDIAPRRVFAKLEYDGSVGQDLAPLAAADDEKCMAQYMPKVAPENESIHQATNSLSITLCKRSESSCEANDSNTFILTIVQHKSFYSFHSVYEPYVVLFQRTAPFKIYGISSKPIWIHGRGKAGEGPKPDFLSVEESRPWDQTEMFYITSLSWKTHGQKYHGYSDDVLFIAFGIEDSKAAGIDVLAGDLLVDLGLCPTS